MPALKAVYDRYHARGFEIIGIALQRPYDRKKLIEFTAQHDMPWPEYFAAQDWNSAVALRNYVNSTPTTYLIDQNGRIVAYGSLWNQLHPASIADKVRELISPPPT